VTTRNLGRHRAAVRPKTPISVLSEAVTANAGTVGRRSAVIAASSGLVVTMGLPAADAAPIGDHAPDEASKAAAAPAPEQAPVRTAPVSAPADAKVDFAGSAFTNVTAPPPPPPPPPVERTVKASRSTERAPLHVSESARGGSIIAIAARYVGTPYRYGGTTPAGFDCSGFTQYVYRQVGISIPRTSGAQAAGGRHISRSEARPGDLVYPRSGGHIGIYAGNGMMYDAPRTGKSVSKRKIWFSDAAFVTYTH
jgi:cell wall-associated NlpC family hydrolase